MAKVAVMALHVVSMVVAGKIENIKPGTVFAMEEGDTLDSLLKQNAVRVDRKAKVADDSDDAAEAKAEAETKAKAEAEAKAKAEAEAAAPVAKDDDGDDDDGESAPKGKRGRKKASAKADDDMI